MPKKTKYLIGIILIIAAMVFIVIFTKDKNYQGNVMGITNTSQSFVRIDSVNIPVEVASGGVSREKGLSGRASLDASSGMIFVFSKPEIPTFWMPDMHFPIDIIWINNNKVVDISANVSNNFNPQNPALYEPREPAQYVLEVNAGFAEKENIKIGDPVSLINIK